jgi:hypothetical protein
MQACSRWITVLTLLSGQTVFLTAAVTEPMRYIAVDREVLRRLLFEDGSLSDLLLSRVDQALRDSGGKGRDGRAIRARATGARRCLASLA